MRYRLDRIAVAAALLIFVAPLFVFSRIPTQDGPLHIDTAAVMLNSLGRHSEFLNRYFDIRWSFETNTLGHFVLLICLRLIPNPEQAEKLFQCVYLCTFSGGLAYFLTAIRPGAWILLPLGLPFAYCYIFHLGFYNNCLSMCGFLWCWGSYLRCQRQITFGNFFKLSLLTFLTWLAHPVGMVAFAAGAFFWAALSLLMLLRRRAQDFRWVHIKRICSPLTIIGIPLAAQVLFVSDKGGVSQFVYQTWSTLGTLLVELSAMNSFGLPNFENKMAVVVGLSGALFLLGLVAAINLWRRHQNGAGLAMAIMTGFYLALFYLAPTDAAGSGYINERLMPYMFFFLVALLAAVSFPPIIERALLTLGIAAIGGLHFTHWPVYKQAEKVEQDYLFAVKQLPEESILYPMHLESKGYDGLSYASSRTDFMVHLAGFYTAGTAGVYLGNIIARWNEGRQVGFKLDVMNGLSQLPPAFPGATYAEVNFGNFATTVGRPVDYVIIYGNFSDEKSNANYYQGIVEKTFDCNLVSPLGLVKLCKKR